MSSKQAISCSCSKCSRSFAEPIELTVIRTDGSPETYHACPNCFSRVNLENREVENTGTSSDKLKKAPNEALRSAPKKDLKEKAKGKKIKPAGCAHFLGYLKTRPKGSPIPDECLLCAAIMECM